MIEKIISNKHLMIIRDRITSRKIRQSNHQNKKKKIIEIAMKIQNDANEKKTAKCC